MGFCLLEHAEDIGIYFAVNPAHVADIIPKESAQDGRPVCELDLGVEIPNFKVLAIGEKNEIQKFLMQASKIGINKAEVTVLSGRDRLKPMPLMFNNSNRVMLVREMAVDEFASDNIDFTTASEAYMEGEPSRKFVERPGTFARILNADGNVPILKV